MALPDFCMQNSTLLCKGNQDNWSLETIWLKLLSQFVQFYTSLGRVLISSHCPPCPLYGPNNPLLSLLVPCLALSLILDT